MTTTDCRKLVPLLEAFVDGELAPETVLEVEQHLVDCKLCTERVRLNDAVRLSIRRSVKSNAQVTDAFRDRIASALAAERSREAVIEFDAEREARSRTLSWRTVVPVAAAAAFTLVWAASANKQDRMARQSQSSAVQASTPMSVEQLLEELVDYHVKGASPQVTEPTLLAQFEPEVGVPLKLPSLMNEQGARWEGGSVVPVNNQRAVSLRYRMAGHRVTLYVYNSRRVPIEATLVRRIVRDEPVYVGERRGVSIAATERRGVGYAIATDLNSHESAELMASLY